MKEPSPYLHHVGDDGKVVIAQIDSAGRVQNVSRVSAQAVDAHIKAFGGVIVPKTEHTKIRARRRLKLVGGFVVDAEETAEDVRREKIAAAAVVDNAAEQARLRFITTGAGQAMEYAASHAEAVFLLRHGELGTAAMFPFVTAEMQACNANGNWMTLRQAAELIVARTQLCNAALAQIKQTRRTAKIAIQAASTVAQITTIVAAVQWPLPKE
jgi:hypothetical protein